MSTNQLRVALAVAMIVFAAGSASAQGTWTAPGDATSVWARKVLHRQATLDRDVPLVQTTWVGAHNSYANPADDKMVDYNQHPSIVQLLNSGVRELVFDVHWVDDSALVAPKIVLCHNNIAGWKGQYCTESTTGNRELQRALEDIKDWVNNGNRDQVVLLKLELADNARHHINQVAEKLGNHISQVTYRTDGGTNHGDLDSASGCTKFPVTTLTKRQVLEAGRNVIMFISHGCISDGGFNDLVYYGDETNKVVITDKITSNLTTALDPPATDISMFRVVDDRTYSGILAPTGTPKLRPSNVGSWLDAGLNLFEMYGFAAQGEGWSTDKGTPQEETSVQPQHMAWSWRPNKPDVYKTNLDCAWVDKDRPFTDAVCTEVHPYACYNPATRAWSVTTAAGAWRDGFAACASDGAAFRVPVSKADLNALNAVLPASTTESTTKVWVSYTDMMMENEWVANPGSLAWIDGRAYQTGTAAGSTTDGSSFNDIDQLVVDLHRGKRRMTKIELSAGKRLDKITFTYSDGRVYGHGSGSSTKTWNLGANEHIIKTEVCTGTYNGSVRVFYVALYSDAREGALFGGEKTDTCVTTEQAGKEIIGMFGRAGQGVDQLGFYLRAWP